RWEGEVGIGERSGIPHLTPTLSAPRERRGSEFYPTPRIARQIRSGVAAPIKSPPPAEASASRIALPTAGKAATIPASPQPLTPSGLVVQRVGLKASAKD